MHRIDSDAHVNNAFSEGDPAQGRPGTKIGATWLNAVQEEIINAIQFMGLALNKADNGQLAHALYDLRTYLENMVTTYDIATRAYADARVIGVKIRSSDGAVVAGTGVAGMTCAKVATGTYRLSHASLTTGSMIVAQPTGNPAVYTVGVAYGNGYADLYMESRSGAAVDLPLTLFVKF